MFYTVIRLVQPENEKRKKWSKFKIFFVFSGKRVKLKYFNFLV